MTRKIEFANTTGNLLCGVSAEDFDSCYEAGSDYAAYGNMTDLSHPVFVETWLLPLILGLIFLIGVTGNFLVIFVILKNKRMRTATNYYILSLAITDFSFLVCCVPFTATVQSTQWYFGNFMCKFSFYLIHVTVQATCITLTAMMVDRYYAIAHPLKSLKTRTPTVAMMVSAGVWIASLVICVPVALYRDVIHDEWYGIRPFCIETWPSQSWAVGWYIYMFVAAYLAPLLIISACMGMILRLVWNSSTLFYRTQSKAQQARQRQKIRKTRMVAVVVLIFAICWLPIHVINIWIRVDASFPHESIVMFGFQLFANCISYANSCVNPIIYAFMSDNFRRRFREVFSCCCKAPPGALRFRDRPGTITMAMTDGKTFCSQTSTSTKRKISDPQTETTPNEPSSTNPDTNDNEDFDRNHTDASLSSVKDTEERLLRRSILV
ncbi:G-protein coupled receptor 54-like [Ptychodera flava]|uniref:G-protein coupled receptor 54-like n=1 Tax=Ptychodera flava TaxID=63121 RepID=UPI00396A2646